MPRGAIRLRLIGPDYVRLRLTKSVRPSAAHWAFGDATRRCRVGGIASPNLPREVVHRHQNACPLLGPKMKFLRSLPALGRRVFGERRDGASQDHK